MTAHRRPHPRGVDGLAALIRAFRLDHEWTQARLAKVAGVSRGTVAHVEAGQVVTPRYVRWICLALGLDEEVEP